MVWIGLHGVMFLFLFSDFYKQNYIEKQKRLTEAKRSSTNGKVHVNDDNNSTQMVGLLEAEMFAQWILDDLARIPSFTLIQPREETSKIYFSEQ